jgi:hypothetical protein
MFAGQKNLLTPVIFVLSRAYRKGGLGEKFTE